MARYVQILLWKLVTLAWRDIAIIVDVFLEYGDGECNIIQRQTGFFEIVGVSARFLGLALVVTAKVLDKKLAADVRPIFDQTYGLLIGIVEESAFAAFLAFAPIVEDTRWHGRMVNACDGGGLAEE